MTRQFSVGANANSPQNGQTTFTSDFLGECFVNYIMIDNQPINQLQPTADFRHYYLQNMIDMAPLTFVTGSKIIFDITPVKLTTQL